MRVRGPAAVRTVTQNLQKGGYWPYVAEPYGKYADGKFSHFLAGSASGTVKLKGHYYPYACSVAVLVNVEPVKKRDLSKETILGEAGDSQLIGRFKVNCELK